jgi:hypothetical protein
MVIAADYPVLDVLWTMLIFYAWVVWIWMMVIILTDVFRRRDIGGWSKALWTVFLIVLPFIGALAYLISQHDEMAQRNLDQVEMQRRELDAHIRSVAGGGDGDGAAEQIAKAEDLRARGVITDAEFDALKSKALAAV